MKHNRILVIDDSRDDVNLLRRSVASVDNKIEVQWIGDAETALSFLENCGQEDFDLILLDIKMPKMSGLEILQRLWSKGQLTVLPPITVFSSSTLTNDKDQAQFFQGVAYQKKPEGYLEMKTIIRNFIAEPPA